MDISKLKAIKEKLEMPEELSQEFDALFEELKKNAEVLTLRQKLARIRAEFSETSIKKSGINKYGGFKYFELCDIVPVALQLFLKYDVTLDFGMGEDCIIGTLYDNCNKMEQPIVFSFPKKSIDDPRSMKMNVVQAIGSEITYYRRYLYCIVLDIAENDSIDCENVPKPTSRYEARAELTNTNVPATELQIEGLKKALKSLREKDPNYEDEIKTIALKTKGFTNISKQECEDLIIKIGGILNDNATMGEQASKANNTDSEAKEDNRD